MSTDPRLMHERVLHAGARGALAIERWSTVSGEVERPVLHHPGAVAILAQPTPDTVLLVRQFRYSLRAWTIEIPAGTRVEGEAPEATALRELAEEAGMSATGVSELARIHPAPGISDEELILYRATLTGSVPAHPDPGEIVGPLVLPVTEVRTLIASGRIRDAKTLIAMGFLR